MKVRLLAVVTVISLSLPPVYADSNLTEVSRQVRTYQYRPDVFADRPLGIGLPANPSILGGYLWYIRLEASARTFLGMEALARLLQESRIPGIDFTNDRTLTTSDVERLFQRRLWNSALASGVYQFRFLKLGGTSVGDPALPTLGRLYDLQVLGLGGKVSDRGLPWLKDLIQLKVLEVESPSVTDEGLKGLSRLNQLERLSLKETAVTDKGLIALSNLPLKQLELGEHITDGGLTIISKMKSLRHLSLARSRITRDGIIALSTLPELHTLFLGPSITDADLAPLAALKNLKRLDLTGARLSDAAADALAALPQLEELALTETGIGNTTLEKLGRLPHLRYLEVSGTKITPEGFAHLHGYEALQVISFSTARRLSRTDLGPLTRFPLLHSILLNGVLLGPDLLDLMRSRLRSGLPSFVREAEAASGDDLDQILEVASAPAEKEPRHHFEGVSGLERIHQAESSLEDVAGTPSAPKIQAFEENEKNFLGEISVGVVSQRKK